MAGEEIELVAGGAAGDHGVDVPGAGLDGVIDVSGRHVAQVAQVNRAVQMQALAAVVDDLTQRLLAAALAAGTTTVADARAVERAHVGLVVAGADLGAAQVVVALVQFLVEIGFGGGRRRGAGQGGGDVQAQQMRAAARSRMRRRMLGLRFHHGRFSFRVDDLHLHTLTHEKDVSRTSPPYGEAPQHF